MAVSSLRLGNPANQKGVFLFASQNLREEKVGEKEVLFFTPEGRILTEVTSILKVDSLPTPDLSLLGKYVLLETDSLIRKCVFSSDDGYSWQICDLASYSFELPLKKVGQTIFISGIDPTAGSERKFLNEKGTFTQAISISIDATSKHWYIDGVDSGVTAEGKNGQRGYHFTPSVSSEGVISWTNDGNLQNPEPVNIKGPQGTRGSKILVGSALTGENTSGQTFPSSGIYGSLVGDLYLNQETLNLYRCTSTGDPNTSIWVYVKSLMGPKGDQGSPAEIVIDPTTKRWVVNGIDTGVVAEGTADVTQGEGISIVGKTISVDQRVLDRIVLLEKELTGISDEIGSEN